MQLLCVDAIGGGGVVNRVFILNYYSRWCHSSFVSASHYFGDIVGPSVLSRQLGCYHSGVIHGCNIGYPVSSPIDLPGSFRGADYRFCPVGDR